MSAIDDGGPAFPQSRIWNAERGEYEDTQQFPGMTLRDWFAGEAIISACMMEERSPTFGDGKSPTYKGISTRAYLLADAMLAARKGGAND